MNLLIKDGLFDRDLLDAVNASWPADDWEGWVRYDQDNHRKMASDLMYPLPPIIGTALSKMASLPASKWAGEEVLPDLSMHGAGLHMLKPGGVVGTHVDADTHPRIGVQRALSMVLWVHERWGPDDGGLLVLDEVAVSPIPGRLALFDCRRQVHEVTRVVGANDRRSLALFWYAAKVGDGSRKKATFG